MLVEAVGDDLLEPLRAGQALQSMLPEVAEADGGGQLRLRQLARRGRGEDLAAMACRGDPGGAVDVEARVVVAAQDGVTRVEAHPDPDLDAAGPVLSGDRPLHLDRPTDRARRLVEGDEEGIALRAHDDAGGLAGFAPHEVVVHRHDRRPGAAERLGESRAALDVGEQECDGALGQLTRPVVHPLMLPHLRYRATVDP